MRVYIHKWAISRYSTQLIELCTCSTTVATMRMSDFLFLSTAAKFNEF